MSGSGSGATGGVRFWLPDSGALIPSIPDPVPPDAGVSGCGDGVLQPGERCDDGNGASGDGCSHDCLTVEQDFVCGAPGQACVLSVVCGDRLVTGDELCDDGNVTGGDGCSADCRQVEPGYSCLVPGLRCEAAACGDGVRAGLEECDFSNATAGCTDCRIDPGWDCTAAGCAETVCGNGAVERGEECDDQNLAAFDGCFQCRREPDCQSGVCAAVCGDGQQFASEACDDGNLRSGDGCSAACEVEVGFACVPELAEPPPQISLPVVFRDFIGEGNSLRSTSSCYNPVSETPSAQQPDACFHIDFNGLNGNGVPFVVEDVLGGDGRPVYACPGGDCDQNPGHLFQASGNTRPNFNGPAPFAEWYDSSSENNLQIVQSLPLDLDSGSGSYVFDASGSFYPLDTVGWVAAGDESLASGACPHNVSFTSETHFWFEYEGGEHFEFSGDDDLWVFVNGRLVIDLGGLHGSQTASFDLDADTDGNGPDIASGTVNVDGVHFDLVDYDIGLEVGGVYELAMFHAERNECGSNFKVTLRDFNRPRSRCSSQCGDGEVASDELCDDGPGGNDGAYGHCSPDCLSRGPHCGDSVVQSGEGEQCDDGVNLTAYGQGCAPGCRTPARCGDSVVDAVFGETCDDGVNDGTYGTCGPTCQLAERCGDGIRQEGEQCDDGNLLSGDGCSKGCWLEVPR